MFLIHWPNNGLDNTFVPPVEKLTLLKNDPGLRRQLAANAIAAAPKYSRTELAARMLTLLEKTVEPLPLSAQGHFR
jgi:hypothetical protein